MLMNSEVNASVLRGSDEISSHTLFPGTADLPDCTWKFLFEEEIPSGSLNTEALNWANMRAMPTHGTGDPKTQLLSQSAYFAMIAHAF